MSPCTLKLNEEKSKDAPLVKEHGFAPAQFAQFAEASNWHSRSVHLPYMSVINMI
jgi:hypothetical protein